MESVNVEFQKAGARGISVLFASGDQGVWGREGVTGGSFHPGR
jgi:subtilase family serine protease